MRCTTYILYQMRDKIRASEYIIPDHTYEEFTYSLLSGFNLGRMQIRHLR